MKVTLSKEEINLFLDAIKKLEKFFDERGFWTEDFDLEPILDMAFFLDDRKEEHECD
jgi:hypothetical protein